MTKQPFIFPLYLNIAAPACVFPGPTERSVPAALYLPQAVTRSAFCPAGPPYCAARHGGGEPERSSSARLRKLFFSDFINMKCLGAVSADDVIQPDGVFRKHFTRYYTFINLLG